MYKEYIFFNNFYKFINIALFLSFVIFKGKKRGALTPQGFLCCVFKMEDQDLQLLEVLQLVFLPFVLV